MLLLTGVSKLATLQRALTRSFPESLQVCGAVYNMIHKNPFRLQVLVDRWPDFTSVVCRPPLEEMMEPLDSYNDVYFMFSKHSQSLSQMLQDPRIINWNKALNIEVCQPALWDMLHTIGSKHGKQMQTLRFLLYMRDGMDSEELEQISNVSTGDLMYTSLSLQDAALVNDKWKYGKNERSLKYVKRCIENCPTVCVRKKGLEQPIAWSVTNSSAEIGLGYTDPAYRNLGIARTMILKLGAANYKRGAPIYAAASADNKSSQAMMKHAKYKLSGEILVITSFQHKSVSDNY
ncbi:glycine N-acyltransferase-like protein 1 [Pseudophryne corroboree]|uniref:glycine N-acyltransferase-like protein 1 n=1 Tax=Pseudophryne corroboree TaxID=495146 RepID=UPI003081E39A